MQQKKNYQKNRVIREMADELIKGMSLDQVPRQNLLQVRNELEKSKSSLISNGEVNLLKRVQTLLSDIDRLSRNSQKSKDGSRTSSRSLSSSGGIPPLSSPKKQIEPPEQSSVEIIFNNLLQGDPVDSVQTSILPYLIDYAKSEIDKLIADGEYREAQKRENVNKELFKLLQKRKTEEKQQLQKLKNENLFGQAKRSYIETEEKHNKILEELHRTLDDSIQQIEEVKERELEDFDRITNGPLPPQNRKFSPKLLNLRETEKHLVIIRNFDEAANIKAEADVLEEQELQELQSKFIKMKSNQRIQLIESFDSKINCTKANLERKIHKAENQKSLELSSIQKMIDHFEEKSIDNHQSLNSASPSSRLSNSSKQSSSSTTKITKKRK